jgi:hypothetical protein
MSELTAVSMSASTIARLHAIEEQVHKSMSMTNNWSSATGQPTSLHLYLSQGVRNFRPPSVEL